MSVFDDEIRGDEASLFREAGDPADYVGQLSSANGIDVILEQGFEVYDEDQVAMRVTTISVLVDDIANSRQGDQVVMLNRTWTVQQPLEDDGHVRRLWVS